MKAEERMIGDDLAATMHPFECFKKELEKRRFYMLQEAIALLRECLDEFIEQDLTHREIFDRIEKFLEGGEGVHEYPHS